MSYSIPDPHYEELLVPGQKPIGNVVIDWGNPLVRGLVACGIFNKLNWRDLSGNSAVAGDIDSTSPELTPKAGSYGVDYDETTDAQKLIEDRADLTGDITFVIVRSPNDTTSRSSSAFGFNTLTSAQRFHSHMPFSDGTVYFDYGGSTAGTTRITWTGYTKVANEIEVWVFLVRGSKMAIWFNGVEVSSDESTTASRTQGANTFFINKGTSASGDFQTVYAAFLYKRGLSDSEIRSISYDPYQFLIPA